MRSCFQRRKIDRFAVAYIIAKMRKIILRSCFQRRKIDRFAVAYIVILSMVRFSNASEGKLPPLFVITCMNMLNLLGETSLIRGDTSNLTIDHCETRYCPIIWVIPYLLSIS